MNQRRVYRISKAGNIKRLRLREESIDDPEENQVQVEVKAIGLNFADIFAIKGLYSASPKGSFIPGLEFCGTITMAGTRVMGLKPGDHVMGVTRFGGYATKVNIEEDYISPLPDQWSFEQGAAFLVQALTAYYGLYYLGDLQENQTVLIHSAAGGVGLLANRMAKRKGAYTIGTIGNKQKIALLKEEGFDDFIVRDKNFKVKLEECLKGRELNIVMECIGGKVFQAGFEMLAPQGRIVNYGAAQYGDTGNSPGWLRLLWLYLNRPKIDPQAMTNRNVGILGFNLIWLYDKKDQARRLMEELAMMSLPPPIVGHQFGFNTLPEALYLFQSGQTTGKVIILTE